MARCGPSGNHPNLRLGTRRPSAAITTAYSSPRNGHCAFNNLISLLHTYCKEKRFEVVFNHYAAQHGPAVRALARTKSPCRSQTGCRLTSRNNYVLQVNTANATRSGDAARRWAKPHEADLPATTDFITFFPVPWRNAVCQHPPYPTIELTRRAPLHVPRDVPPSIMPSNLRSPGVDYPGNHPTQKIGSRRPRRG